jgi:manganese oxidase
VGGSRFTRRKALVTLGPIVGAGAVGHSLISHRHPWDGDASAAAHEHGGKVEEAAKGSHGHAGFTPGVEVNHRANGFDPHDMLRDFDWGSTRRLATGGVLREWELIASDKEIEVAPGVKFPAWAYNGRVPGPTLRCREGDRLRIRFVNASSHPHTIHFHGIHPSFMDGVPGIGAGSSGGLINTGESFTYEFGAAPFGLHHYHCHASPLPSHIAKGLYGAFIVDPKRGRPDADEMVLVQNGFDTNFDSSNEVYAVNTVGFAYLHRPIRVKRDELVRIYLVNILEFDQINSFHIHGNFFHYYPTGTSLEPAEFTDTIMQAQGQRGILELRFPYAGRYMFHAHKSEFAELGWMGFFEVED